MLPERRHFIRRASLLGSAAALGPGALFAQAPGTPGSSVASSTPLSPAALEAKAPPMPALGTVLTLPDVPLLDGSRFLARQAAGQVLVIYWWASDCPFCALQSPEMQKLWLAQSRLGSKGLQLLTLSVDRRRDDAVAYLRKKGYTFPAGWVTPEIHRVLPKPRGLPITLVRGRDGRLLQAEKGQLFPEDIELIGRWAA